MVAPALRVAVAFAAEDVFAARPERDGAPVRGFPDFFPVFFCVSLDIRLPFVAFAASFIA
jgi:hypothetical protein